MDTITIIQHNVQSWNNRNFHVISSYKQINPDIILINSHGLINNENIKIVGYSLYTKSI